MAAGGERRVWAGDALAALAMAAAMTAIWAARDWARLSALHLPDTDDAMRLVQIRDWLAGQGFADLTQHRLAGGLAMHWSRLADLVPAAIVAVLAPMFGAHRAELTAVILWPALLLGAAMLLAARITRALSPDAARVAVVLVALAFPATTVFLPGRIDHHGLQVVLLLGIVGSLVAPPTLARGIAAGLCAAASLVVGLETAPLIAVAALAMVGRWCVTEADDGLLGLGLGMTAGLIGAAAMFAPTAWRYPACDGFTLTLWRGASIGAVALVVIALAGGNRTGPARRMGLAATIGVPALAAALLAAPACLSPYGGVDPLLRTLWLGRVGEAQPLLAAPGVQAIGYAGVMVAGIVAAGWHWHATRDRRWLALLAVQVAAFGLTCAQLRGGYAGAMLAVPALAAGIVEARRRGIGWALGAWLGSAGLLYPLLAEALVPAPHRRAGSAAAAVDCTGPATIGALARLRPGTLLAPLDLGPYALAATRHRIVAAPYHRNDAGNLAFYRFFLDPAASEAIARRWRVDYVVLCDASFAGLPREPAMAARLRTRTPPPWLAPVATGVPGLHVWRVR